MAENKWGVSVRLMLMVVLLMPRCPKVDVRRGAAASGEGLRLAPSTSATGATASSETFRRRRLRRRWRRSRVDWKAQSCTGRDASSAGSRHRGSVGNRNPLCRAATSTKWTSNTAAEAARCCRGKFVEHRCARAQRAEFVF